MHLYVWNANSDKRCDLSSQDEEGSDTRREQSHQKLVLCLLFTSVAALLKRKRRKTWLVAKATLQMRNAHQLLHQC